MNLKAKTILSAVIAGVLTIGLVVFLAVAFMYNFPLWSSLTLLGVTIVTMVAWVFYYITFAKYKESLNPKKKKYTQRGNRKESRKAMKK